MSHPLFDKHRATLDRALVAIAERGYWSPYPESASPRNYGEGAAEAGKAAFDALLGKPFALTQPATTGQIGAEKSPFGMTLGVTYPSADLDALFAAVDKAQDAVAQGGTRSVGRRLSRDPRSHQQAELRDRQRGHAHDRPGVHDGVPGGRPARAGSRARSSRVRMGRDAARAGAGAMGEAAGQERADQDATRTSASCRAA